MTRRTMDGDVLSEAEARARGLVPTREAAGLYGCWRDSLCQAMRVAGVAPTLVRHFYGGRIGHWWFPRDVLAVRKRNVLSAQETRRPRRHGTRWTKQRHRKMRNHYRRRLLARIAQREAGR